MNRRLAASLGTTAALVALAACSDPVSAPVSRAPVLSSPLSAVAATWPGTSAIGTVTPEIQSVAVCNAGPQSADFTASKEDVPGDATDGTLHAAAFTLPAGQCTLVASKPAGDPNDVLNPPSDNSIHVTVSMVANFQSVAFAFTADKDGCPVAAPSDLIGPEVTVCFNNFHGAKITFTTTEAQTSGCTYTQGFWKTHGPSAKGNNSNEWPVNALTLGSVNYTDTQLQSIFDTAPKGNGLISLAHQLIAAKLNVENGANDPDIGDVISDADALIGALVVPPVGNGYLSPSDVSALVDALADFNEGTTGPGHCSDEVLIS